MTYIVPNYFLENKPNAIISADSIFTLAYSSRQKQERIEVHNTTHAMILLLNGSKKLTTKDEEIELKSKSILLLQQGNYFMSEVPSHSGLYEAILIYFDDSFIMDFMKKYKIEPSSYESKTICAISCDKLLGSLVDSFALYINQELEQKNEILKLKTEEIFLHLLSKESFKFLPFLQAIKSTSKERIRYILEANIEMIESVEDMCRIAMVSKNELRRAIQNSFKMKPKAWLDKKRLERASLLLKTTNEPISSIATSCGYATVSWFGVQFKKYYGVSPKEYRKQGK